MTTTQDCDARDSDLATRAKSALEHVCSGAGREPASRYYSPSFEDHVNGIVFHGLKGVERSVAMYKRALSDLEISVQEQIVQGDRVVSRFVVAGTNRGRRVQFNGITISRFENGMIVEDWSVTDSLGMLRQLGVWRSLAMIVDGVKRSVKRSPGRARPR
jgi:predicted ester cyclase